MGVCHAVFSIEAQPIGLVRHLSVSLISTNAYPNILAVELLGKEFGLRFNETEKSTTIWTEEHAQAVNVAEHMIEQDMN